MPAVYGERPIATVHRTNDSFSPCSGLSRDGSTNGALTGVMRFALNMFTSGVDDRLSAAEGIRAMGVSSSRRDAEHYNYFRDYDPGIGRYIESDPIGLRGGLNPFDYVWSSPFSWTDPLGLAPRRLSADSQECKDLEKKIRNIRDDIDKRKT